MTNSNSPDFVIIGAGAAGLLLADALGRDAFFDNKSILILEKDSKTVNDRTWCFWEKDKGQFDELLHKSWHDIQFAGKNFRKDMNISPYSYKMLRGIDFYKAYLNRIASYPNIRLSHENVVRIEDDSHSVKVYTDKITYTTTKVFNSIFDYKKVMRQNKYPVLQQHFIGWFIKTEKPVFKADTACFMDFSVPQKGNTRFMYVLPFSDNEALVEYTLFSEHLLGDREYELAIKAYISSHLQNTPYEITETEKGSIPMTCFNFEAHNSENVIAIGTAGGWSKPSTGFTFMNTVQNVVSLVSFLKVHKPFTAFSTKKRFWYYDLLLLDILYRNNEKGHTIFEALFRHRSPQLILKFLEEKTSFWQDLLIISACPKRDFIKAMFRRLF